jgi:predicted restriction endonuclease
LDGDLDKKVQTAQRTEQGIARKKLLKNKQIAPCRLCGREMSKDFLVAAHIKKRSRCTDAEKRDLVNVTMLCCRFGCDELYERGFLGVDQDGKILVSSQLLDSTAKDYSTNRKLPIKKEIDTRKGTFLLCNFDMCHAPII